MPATPLEEPPAERNTVLLIVVGTLVLLSVVIAGLVIFSDQGVPAARPEKQPAVAADGSTLVVGKPGGQRPKVVVYEDFGSPASRAFDIASRDFLRIEAAQDHVVVEYHPVLLSDGSGASYARSAIDTWSAVLAAGTPKQALAFQDALFDHQPAAGGAPDFASWAKERGLGDAKLQGAIGNPDATAAAKAAEAARAAGVGTLPTVLLQGEPLTAASPVALADRLQRALLASG